MLFHLSESRCSFTLPWHGIKTGSILTVVLLISFTPSLASLFFGEIFSLFADARFSVGQLNCFVNSVLYSHRDHHVNLMDLKTRCNLKIAHLKWLSDVELGKFIRHLEQQTSPTWRRQPETWYFSRDITAHVQQVVTLRCPEVENVRTWGFTSRLRPEYLISSFDPFWTLLCYFCAEPR